MAKKNISFPLLLKVVLGTAILGCIFICSIAVYLLYRNGKYVYEYRSNQVNSLMREKPEFFSKIFNEVLPQMIKCTQQNTPDCVKETRAVIDSYYLREEVGLNYINNGKLRLTGNLPLYFIKLEDNKLIKLFLSGDLKTEEINTSGEKAVQDLLLGKSEKLYGLQANVEIFEMTYLNDFDAEAEVIIPVKENSTIIGAIVFLHGD